MANVIHRTTLQFLRSVNEPDYPEPTWKHNPDMSAVAGVAEKYWKAPPDWNAPSAGPVEQDAGEKAATDAALLTAGRDSETATFDDLESYLRAIVLVLVDELNDHSTAINGILDAIDNANNLADMKSAVALIADVPQRTPAQARTAIRNKLGS